MAVLERVATLVRANLNDLIDRAEDPEKMIKQVILDMENQLLQVKTQVAISMADQHLLQKKQTEHEDKAAEWMRKAELAVDKGRTTSRARRWSVFRASRRRWTSYRQQVDDQRAQVTTLKAALGKLDQKLAEAQAKSDTLLAQHRRARALGKASDAQIGIGDRSAIRTFDRMKQKVSREEAVSQAKSELAGGNLEDRFTQLERDDEVDRLLAELKARRGVTA